MTNTFTRIISVSLIVSLSLIHVTPVLADVDSASSTPVILTSATSTPTFTATSTSATLTPLTFPFSMASTTASSTPDIILATSTNNATSTTEASSTATTGNNVASSTATTTIVTGTALATTNITNIVNVNILNSDVLLAFLNRLSSGNQNVDLGTLLTDAKNSSACNECTLATTSVVSTPLDITTSSNNNGQISNTTIVRSDTGSNTASGSTTSITTGNAYANANVATVANANFINSHYVMVVLNNFGSLSGDIVLPAASFFDSVLSPGTQSSNSTVPTISATATNTAAVVNTISTSADSGNNTATGTDSSLIQTGDARTGSNVLNTINQNILGGSSVALVFRIYGNWSGKAFNMPTHLMWHNTPVGITFMNSADDVPQALGTGSINASNINNATVNNTISVSASTGNNTAFGSTTSITTGNAYANANVVNVVNTNVIGRNWINAIINVFGDWTGNISFGQPNLWVGTRADFTDGNSNGGSSITYHYTIKNTGNAPAHNVHLSHTFDQLYISFESAAAQDAQHGWDIGSLAPGEVKEVSYKANIVSENDLPYGNTPVVNTMQVTSTETDADLSDNTDTLTTLLSRSLPSYNNYVHSYGAHFTITKTNNATSALAASSTVDYTITIKNTGDEASHAMLDDFIKTQAGDTIHTEEWDLGAVKSQEEITVTYTALFNASSTPGVYTNNAQVTSADNTFESSAVASSSISIIDSTKTQFENATSTSIVSQPKVLSAFTARKHRRQSLSYVSKIIATTSTTISPFFASTDTKISGNKNYYANALSALGSQSWYWYGLILAGAGYLAIRSRNLSI